MLQQVDTVCSVGRYAVGEGCTLETLNGLKIWCVQVIGQSAWAATQVGFAWLCSPWPKSTRSIYILCSASHRGTIFTCVVQV
jgi:hypothetical protein